MYRREFVERKKVANGVDLHCRCCCCIARRRARRQLAAQRVRYHDGSKTAKKERNRGDGYPMLMPTELDRRIVLHSRL
ncbi:hypothetical protein PUN28_016818 [Cardiocondyla obscurior]|uniref:Uncharacterized protein n=1 Tax=Cardiocondyla obscurior TaxID=286306 RepID=A0AAW2ESL6_9HYME